MKSDYSWRAVATTWIGVLLACGLITGYQDTTRPVAEGRQVTEIASVTLITDHVSVQISSKPNAPEWLTAFGTIAAVIVALLLALGGQWVGEICWHPVLNLEAKVQRPASDKVRRMQRYIDHFIDTGEYYYFRLAITNTGNTAAKDVQVFLSKVERLTGGRTETVDRFTPMNLIWTNTEQLSAKDRVTRAVLLADTPPVYCDLAHVGQPDRRKPSGEDLDDVDTGKAVLGLDVEVPTYSKGHLLEPGIYRLHLTLAASNCASTHHVVKVWFPGDWFPEDRDMFERGFKMEKEK